MRATSWRSPADDERRMVELTLEMEPDSPVVRSVAAVGSARLSPCSSTASRRKFPWLWSPSSPSRCSSFLSAMAARDERRTRARLDRSRSDAQRALNGLRFIRAHDAPWEAVERRFHSLAQDGHLRRQDFGKCIGMADSEEFAEGVFVALARRRQRRDLDRITVDELREFWAEITDQSFDARLQIFFDMVDANVDGRITREEVQELIVLSASANKLAKLKEQAGEYAALIMEELDPEALGYIELWQLEALLLQRDHYMNHSRPLSSVSMGRSQRMDRRRRPWRPWLAAQEHWQRVWVLFLWVAAMTGLFTWKFIQYRRRPEFHVMGYCLPVAKGASETLKLNMGLVLLPVCRNALTYLRSTPARFLFPLDDNINFHKIIAAAIAVGVAVHAGNHLACNLPRVVHATPEQLRSMASDFGGGRPTYRSLVGDVEGVTGITMTLLMAVVFTLATGLFRKKVTGFNAFWYSHHLLVVVYILLLVHGFFMDLVHRWYQKTTWMYVAGPVLLYLGERTLRIFRSEAFSVGILKVTLLPGDVLAVVMSKPLGFKYKSGQYVFLKCPAVSPFEWHPFSITSAPGDGYLSVHIRALGDWTRKLQRILTEPINGVLTSRGTLNDTGPDTHNIASKLLVDGPYGSPAQNYSNYDVLLLVGLGIGATPFISILRDLLNNIKSTEEQLDSSSCTDTPSKSESSWSNESGNSCVSFFGDAACSSSSNDGGKKRSLKTSRAHFYWVTRELGSFEWFKGVMDEVAGMDHKGMIDMHNYLTSVYEEGDARSTLLTMVQALNHAKHGVDILSGTRVRTHFARPNWREVFSRIATKHPSSTVGVFYCGTPVLAKELKSLSQELSYRTTTRFHFHKEYF